MRKTPNPHAIRFIINLIAAIAVILLVTLILYGCNTPKQIERKDQAAVDRVSAKRPLLDKIAPAIFALYGNGSDTVLTFLPGGIDSIPYPVPQFDEKAKQKTIDSLTELHSDSCTEIAKNAYEMGFDYATEAIRNMKLPVKRPDTAVYNIKDQQLHGLYEQHIKDLNADKSKLKGQVQQMEKQIIAGNQRERGLFWLIIAAVALLVGSNLYWIVNKFKKPLP